MARTRRPTLRHSFVRSFASLSVMFVLFAGMAVVRAEAPVADPGAHPDGAHAGPVSGPPLWETAYSERYPGCVSMVLWPLDEVPVALVTRTPGGDVSRVPLDEVDRAPLSPVGRAHAIGACRRSVSSAR